MSSAPSIVPRTCTEVRNNVREKMERTAGQPFESFRGSGAYVLLGDPGAGKTTSFRQEADRSGGCYVTARDFLTFDDQPEWHGRTLFIDGLDEVRAGAPDGRTPVDAIRRRLDRLERPPFRISCREADWFGASDREALKQVSPTSEIATLHLDPLTEMDIREILSYHPKVEDVAEFMESARHRGLMDLIENPQILDMLVKAVSGGRWPSSRKETFELACRSLLPEHNREHLDAGRTNTIAAEEFLDAAGFLSAVQLLAGLDGFSLTPTAEDAVHPVPELLEHRNPDLLHRVLKSKLFKKDGEERRTSLHRSVAEYLGARHLAGLVRNAGLPMGRVLALMTGDDGVVVSALRGLHAWLAALCLQERQTLIDRDPLGVVLYGDVSDFVAPDKRRILEGLRKDAERYTWFRSSDWTAHPFSALSTPDMELTFAEIIRSDLRDDVHQSLTDCVLESLEQGGGLSGLAPYLLAMVRDCSWWPRLREQALRIYLSMLADDERDGQEVKALLEDLRSGKAEDPADEILAGMLNTLYPGVVTPARVFDYLHVPKNPDLIGSYHWFWVHKLEERSSNSQVFLLFDELVRRRESVQTLFESAHLFRMSGDLLARGLETAGEEVDGERLYRWLGIGLDEHFLSRLDAEHSNRVAGWFADRPEKYKSIIKRGYTHCAAQDHFNLCMDRYRSRLYGAATPSGLGRWLLQQAEASGNTQAAEPMFRDAVSTLIHEHGHEGLSLRYLEDWVEVRPKFRDCLQDMLFCTIDDWRVRFAENKNKRAAEIRARRSAWIQHVIDNQTEIQYGAATPKLLHDLAKGYFGRLYDARGETPGERLGELLNDRLDLVDSVLNGFRAAVYRTDLPSVREIFRLAADNQVHYIALPFQAGLEEIARPDPARILELNEARISRALAFYFAGTSDSDSVWFELVLQKYPKLVANILVDYGATMLRAGKEHVAGLYALAYQERYAVVADHATLPLLARFPVRARHKQNEFLGHLLRAALRRSDSGELRPLIDCKLALSSMDVAQRVHWLAAGLILDPEAYEQPLLDYVVGREKRIQVLAGFVSGRYLEWTQEDSLPAVSQIRLIGLLGAYYSPYRHEGGGLVSPAMNASDFISHLIENLGASPDKRVTEGLERLLTAPSLAPWNERLRGALYHQRAVRREADYRHPDVQQVSRTLGNLGPANAADLAALTIEHLQELSRAIRDASTDDYKQYWNVDRYGHPTTPKPENDCRDALLSDLKQRLAPLRIDAQPEGHYAEGKRADIRVSFGGTQGFNVPVEIKRNKHRDLWRAARDQLIAQYVRDPGAHGLGIYLVFWFGPCVTQPPPEGDRPRTAPELAEMLRLSLTDEESRRISVCVIDCAKPGAEKV